MTQETDACIGPVAIICWHYLKEAESTPQVWRTKAMGSTDRGGAGGAEDNGGAKGHRSLAESNVQKFKVELGDRWTMPRPEDWRTTVEVWWI